MPVKFFLRPSPFAKNSDECIAGTHSVEVLDEEDLIKEILLRESTITESDAVAVLRMQNQAISDAIAAGRGLNLPLLRANYSVKGKFADSDANFIPGKNKVRLNITKGQLLRAAEEKLTAVKASPPKPVLEIRKITNVKDMLEVKGRNIKIEGDNPACGLWLVDTAGMETKLQDIISNLPSRITGQIPTLAPGAYTIKIVTQFTTGGELLKKPRKFVYDEKPLII